MADMSLFPYVPRGEQEELVEFIRKAVVERRNAVIESGTGTGKTICSLVGVLEDQPYHKFKVLYLTRTKSQQKQVISEIRMINAKRSTFCVAIQGRTPTTCPMMSSDPELSSGSPDELSKWCSEFKKRKGKEGGCPYFDRISNIDVDVLISEMRTNLPDPESFQRACLEKGLCPYEMSKIAIPFADVVCAPYPFLLSPASRLAFLGWMEVIMSDLVIIVDEAHNVPDYLRDIITTEYTKRALDYVDKEAGEWGDPVVFEDIRVTDITNVMRVCFDVASKEYLKGDDGLIPPHFLQEELMSRLMVTSNSLDTICKSLIDLGEIVVAKKKEMRKLPRSYMRSLGSFIRRWMDCDDECFAKLINGGDRISFEAYCMDPYLAAEPFRSCRSSIHMSGTLEPLEEYAEELGLDDAVMRSFKSPFDPANLLTLCATDVTTRHDDMSREPEMISYLEDWVVRIVQTVVRNVAVFFPSYDMMNRFIVDDVPERTGRDVYVEVRGMSQMDLMDTVDNFRTSEGSVLFAVAGGRISEGLDFPDKDLEIAIIVGIPYPYPTVKMESLIRYSDFRFGNGWEHVVRTPTIRKMRQARGRLIRSETDRGVCVVLDRRVPALPGFDIDGHDDIIPRIRSFFENE